LDLNYFFTQKDKLKNKDERGFFDEQFRLEKISKQNGPLVLLKELIPWEIFIDVLNDAFRRESKGIGGCESFDYLITKQIQTATFYFDVLENNYFFYWRIKINH